MNEKFDKEIDRWFGITERDCNGKPIPNFSDWKETNDTMMSMNVPSIQNFAKHFYNLALEDVKKEIETRFTYLHEICLKGNLTDYGAGQYYLTYTLKNFIDNLTK